MPPFLFQGSRLALRGCLGGRLAGLLGFFFILMVVPGADGGVDEAAKEEKEADEEYDPRHSTVKSMSFSHTGGLAHKGFLEKYPHSGDSDIKA